MMRVAFLGMGRRSLGFMRALDAAPGVDVVAGADTWDAARENAQRLCPAMQTYMTPAALFRQHTDVDLAMVCSRECDHEAFALEAFGAGAHVFCEKPMAITPDACRRMIAGATAAERSLMVGFNLRFHPTVMEAKRFVDSGRVGRLRAIWEWHEVDLNYFHNWMSVRAFSGGLLFEKGSHDFDLFNWFAGAEAAKVAAFGGLDLYGGNRPNDLHCPDCAERETCVETVRKGHLTFAGTVPNLEQTKCAFRSEIDVCDNHVVNLLYQNGVKGSYTELHGSPSTQRRFVLFGENGRLEFEIERNTLLWRPRQRDGEVLEWQAERGEGGHGGADNPLHQAILAVFRDGAPTPITARDGLDAVRVSYAGELALRTHTVVDVSTL